FVVERRAEGRESSIEVRRDCSLADVFWEADDVRHASIPRCNAESRRQNSRAQTLLDGATVGGDDVDNGLLELRGARDEIRHFVAIEDVDDAQAQLHRATRAIAPR